MATTAKDRLIDTLISQRTSVQKKLTNWADKNILNMELEKQLTMIDARIDMLLLPPV